MLKNKKKLIAFIIFLIFWGFIFYQCFKSPKLTIIVKYKEVPPVIKRLPKNRINVYYRGFNVGKVSKMELSKDQQFIVFYLNITYKNLKLPKNIKIYLNTEDLYGSRHFSIFYPEAPSNQILKNNDEIMGTGYNDRIDAFLVNDLKYGQLNKLLSNLITLTNMIKKEDITSLKTSLQKSLNETEIILKDLKEITHDPTFKTSLKSTIKETPKSLTSINKLIESKEFKKTLASTPASIDTTIKNLELINKNMPEINKTVKNTNESLFCTNSNLKTLNTKVPDIPPSLIENADKTLKEADCLTNELIDILSKKFLIFKFMFSNPAKSLQKCKTNNCPANK